MTTTTTPAAAPAADAVPMGTAISGSQIDIADQFAEMTKERLRYVWAERQWYYWNGTVWRVDDTGRVREMIKQFLGKVSLGTPGSDNMLRTLASDRAISGVEHICQSHRLLAATEDQWDADPTLLCTPEGIVDLVTGEMRAARPEDYCRKITAVAPAPPGTPLGPCTMMVLEHMTGEDAALMRYIQKVIGYCFTGGQQEKKMFVVIGEPDSGKTTLFETVSGIALDYATVTNVENFLEDPRGMRTSTNDLAELRGYRLVISTEPDRNAKLSASRIKRNVGNDRTSTRLNYKQGKVGAVTYKIVMHCNEIPRHDQGEQAVRNRLDILPGGKSVPPSKQDRGLPEKLREEWPATLRWIIDGAVMWNAEGLADKPIAAVDVADEYNRSQDPVRAWHDARVEQAPEFTPTTTLYNDYVQFARDAYLAALSLDEFSKRLGGTVWIVRAADGKSREYRYEADRLRVEGKPARGFHGLRLCHPTEDKGGAGMLGPVADPGFGVRV